jgi:hypothetical protein
VSTAIAHEHACIRSELLHAQDITRHTSMPLTCKVQSTATSPPLRRHRSQSRRRLNHES